MHVTSSFYPVPAAHCQKCGNTCSKSLSCIDYKCKCKPEQKECNKMCIDPKTDLNNCGGQVELLTGPAGALAWTGPVAGVSWLIYKRVLICAGYAAKSAQA